jgi:hypothetical protein
MAHAAWTRAVVESVAVAPAVEGLMVVFPLPVVPVAFCYSALAERALVASRVGLLRRVFGRLSLPDRHPGQCYHTVIRCGHSLVVALALVSAILPVFPPASAASGEEW